jgi:hypothetical protein
MAAFTDAQLLVLAQDVVAADDALATAQANAAAARKALARALGAGTSVVIRGRMVTANDDATDVNVSGVRVVA